MTALTGNFAAKTNMRPTIAMLLTVAQKIMAFRMKEHV